MVIKINKTDENSKISGWIPKILRIVEKIIWVAVICLILGLILLGISQFLQAIGNLSDARAFLSANPGILYWKEEQESAFFDHIFKCLWNIAEALFFWGVLAFLVYFRVIWTEFPFGEEKYVIGYSLILGETTTTFTTLRVALRLWPIYDWKHYAAERKPEETSLENLTTKDDSTINGKFYFGAMPWLDRASIMRGVRELNPDEISGSWKGLIKQYAPNITRQYTSAQLINNPALVVEGIIERIAIWKNELLKSEEIEDIVSEIVTTADITRIVNAAKSEKDPSILMEIQFLVDKLSERIALILYQSEIETKITKLCAIYIKDLQDPDKALIIAKTILNEIAEGGHVGISKEEIKSETSKLISGSGGVINYAMASILKRLTFEPERNPEEIDAARQIFQQQSLNLTRIENFQSIRVEVAALAKEAGVSFMEAFNMMLLTERPQGKDPSAKKIIIEGGSSLEAAVASYLSKDDS